MSFSQSHNRAFRTEIQKLKHSGTLWLCFGAALFIPLLTTIVSFFVEVGKNAGGNRWDLLLETNFQAFTGFFYPVFLVLTMVRLVYLEHRSDTWKLMETQPVPRWALFFAKWEVAVLLSLACLAGLLLFSLMGGMALQLFKKSTHLADYHINWTRILVALLRFWISGLAILSAQYFFSLLIKSFAWPMGLGLMATIAGGIFTGFGVFTWWPYATTALTSRSFEGSITGDFLMAHEKLSILWSILLLLLAYQLFKRKTFRRAVIFPFSRLIISVVLLGLFIALAWLVSRPTELKPYGRTVLAGTVTTEKPVSSVVLLRAPAYDTVMLADVRNESFHMTTGQKLEEGIYFLKAGNLSTPIYFGGNDSLYVVFKDNEYRPDIKIRGSLLAENEFLQKNGNHFYWQLQNRAYSFTPAGYVEELVSEWKDGLDEINRFQTTDRIKPRTAFLELQKKLLAIRLLHFADNFYPNVFAVYHPNETLTYPEALNGLRKIANVNDPAVAGYSETRTYVSEQLRNKTGASDSLFLEATNRLPGGTLRDLLLYDAVQNNLMRIRDSARRNQLFREALRQITDASLQMKLLAASNRMQNLQRGKPAPMFRAASLASDSFALSQLAGRYVLIDVWATWCGPCKKESPYFEELAEQYTSEQLAFVSISVDENKNDWLSEASGKKNKVLQLWASNVDADFKTGFAIQTIPRFMLIGPKGDILSADMPPPSDPQFEAILKREIPTLGYRN